MELDCSSLVDQVMDKGKRGAAEFIKNGKDPELLNKVLDRILSHENSINNNTSIEWLKWLMAGGKTPDEFTASVKKYNNAATCGLVWTAQFVAYRCRTCGISPCMSLCADCFLKGQHEGHDFNMFRSQAGGACDCGDTSVMRSSGFCDKHGVIDNSDSMIPPPDLLYVAELMIPRILFRLILHLRNFKRAPDSQINFDADDFLAMLSEFSGMGAAMRRVLTSALTNKQVYQKLTQQWVLDESSFSNYMLTSQTAYEEAIESMGNPDPPPEFENCPGLQKYVIHSTFLEELVFWTVKYEFPQKVVCFLLNMLPDIKYKISLTEAFVVHYSRVAMVLEKASDPDTLSNRVVHISVQLFSNEKLAIRMAENFCLLQVMVVSLKNMMSKILVVMPVDPHNLILNRERPKVVNCVQSVMKEHCYWPLVSDLNNVLSHRPVAVQFMSNETLTDMWFQFLSYFQGMNINLRELIQHIEFEPNTYYAAFSAELEASAYPMWALLSHLNDKSTIPLTKRMLNSALAVLEEWLDAVIESDSFDDNQVSFHIPLHRYLATFICQAVNVQQLPLSEILPRQDLIPKIVAHPLRIQVAFYEIVNGLWVRNGLQIKGQAMTYIQCNFCSSMVDADLYLLQILCTQMPTFMQTAIEKFHLKDWLNFNSCVKKVNPSTENDETPMLESFLQFLAKLCSNRTNLGVEYYGDDPQYSVLNRLEMVTLLCITDRTHSQLMESMPERCGTGQSRDFDAILAQVADYKPPNFEVGGNMQQGLYIPKPCVWEELYDPVHVLLRAVQNRKDFQNSMDRYTDFVKQNNLFRADKVVWPPFRIPKTCNSAYIDPRCILNSHEFFSFIWIILYKAVHLSSFSEHVLSLAIYLLEIALTIPSLPSYYVQAPTNYIASSNAVSYEEESIISLLLRLHSQLSKYPDSFNPDSVNYGDLDVRIGDGPFFISKVLIRIMLKDEVCRKEVLECRDRLWPERLFKVDEEKKDTVDQISEKKRIAQERQKRLIESFQEMRNEFIRNNIDVAGEDIMDWEGNDSTQTQAPVTQKKYDCVICNQSSPSTEDQPMGLVVLVQATSVLGHKRKFPERAVLPMSDKDKINSFYCDTLANDFEKKVEELSREFEQVYWWQSINLGWEGGIHVQTCGHHLHLECLTSYLNSLQTQPRIAVDRYELKKGEYLCPLCRQLANSILPVPPDNGDITAITSRQDNIKTSILEIANLLIDVESTTDYSSSELNQSSNLMNAMKQSMKDMTESTYPKFVQRCDPKKISTFFLFVTSIARTNLEIDIVQRGGSLLKLPSPSASEKTLSPLTPKRSCIMPLLHVLATHARMMEHPPVWQTWQQLTDVLLVDQNMLVPALKNMAVPLLLCDPVALLIQLVLLLPLNMDQTYYIYIVKFLYNLLYFQVITQLSCNLKESERNYFHPSTIGMANYNSLKEEFSLDHAMKLAIAWMRSMQLYLEDGNNDSIEEPAYESLELKIQEMCLPFLRVASVLRHHMYNEPLPEVLVEADEFVRLVYYLKLVSHGMDRSRFNSAVVLTWLDNKIDTIEFWFEQFSYYARQSQISARNFLAELHTPWKQPKLLQLPLQYDRIFQYYQRKKCGCCSSVPQDGSICLVCGTLVCFKDSCCKRKNINEAIQHAIDCGAGTAMFLVVTTSCIIVVRGKRACIWGSVYLDVFGEEDRELKRGKPLYLSIERYNLLERQWLSHSFDHTSKKWILHRDNLYAAIEHLTRFNQY